MKKLLSFPHVGTMGTAHGNDGGSTWEHRTDFETIKNRLDSFIVSKRHRLQTNDGKVNEFPKII